MRDYSEVMNRAESKAARLLRAPRSFISLSPSRALAAVCLLVTACTTPGAAPSFPEASALPAQTALPDPLLLSTGHRVASKDQWVKERRPELKALFEHYMYGPLPDKPAQEDSKLAARYTDFLNGKATL